MNANSLKRVLLIATIIVLAYLEIAPSVRQAATPPPAAPVEYMVVEMPPGRAAKQAVLEKYGKEGWQLVALDFAHEESFIFKR